MTKSKIGRSKYRINPFHMALTYVKYDFEEIEALAEFIESTIRRELKHIKKWAEDEVKKTRQNQVDSFYENIGADYQQINQDFRQRLRYGLVVMIYSVVESRLNDACRICKHAINKAILEKSLDGEKNVTSTKRFPHQNEIFVDYTDLKCKGIERASSYLQKNLKLSFPQKGRAPWQNIKILADIRHCIVHSDGVDDEKKMVSFIKKYPDFVKYSDRKQLEIEAQYCTWIIGQAKDFFTEFYDSNMGLVGS